MKKSESENKLLALEETVKILREKEGCPWERAQTHQSLKKYLLEETYEVLQAIDQDDPAELREELGDLLFQIVLHAQIASEKKNFDLQAVAQTVTEKMINRHPHVFADPSLEYKHDRWEEIKKAELTSKKPRSLFHSIPLSLPALARAVKVIKKIIRNKQELPAENFLSPAHEERLGNLMQEINSPDELGKFLLSVLKLSQEKKLDPEDALRVNLEQLTNKF